MRKVSMKGKRSKSEAVSDSESEENGAGQNFNDRSSDEDKSDTSLNVSATSLRKSSLLRKKRSSRGKNKEKEENGDDDDDAENSTEKAEQNGAGRKSGGGKRRKKGEPEVEDEDGEEYEVEKIVGQRTIKGRRQFLVRWKGYAEDSDTWEQEKDLNCSKLIEEFTLTKDNTEEETDDGTPIKSETKSKVNKKAKKGKKEKGNKNNAAKDEKKTGADSDEEAEYEVERIIEVRFKKNKAREFLIRWKGFTSNDDTWEPEDNLNCPDLIAKFMDKVDKAKGTELRELRANPKHTKRYTLTMHGKRQSRRYADKQRATYHECDE